MNLENLNASSGKSENFHFDVLLILLIAYKVSAKKSQKNYLMTLRKDQNFEKKLTFCLKIGMRNLVSDISSNGPHVCAIGLL